MRCCCSHWCRFSGPGRGQSHLRAGSSGAAVQAAAVPRRARITAARLLLQCGPDRAARDNICGGRLPVAARLPLGQQRPGERRWRGRGARPRRGDRPGGTGRRRWPRQRTSSSCGRAAGAKMSAALNMSSCYSVLELTVGPDRSWPLAAALVSCLVLRMGIGVVFKVQVSQFILAACAKKLLISCETKKNDVLAVGGSGGSPEGCGGCGAAAQAQSRISGQREGRRSRPQILQTLDTRSGRHSLPSSGHKLKVSIADGSDHCPSCCYIMSHSRSLQKIFETINSAVCQCPFVMTSHSLKAKDRMYLAVRQYQLVLIIMSDSRCLHILKPDEK